MKQFKVITIFIFFVFISCKDQIRIRNFDADGKLILSIDIDNNGVDTLKYIKISDDKLSFSMKEGYVRKRDTITEYYQTGQVFLKIVPIERYYIYFEEYSQKGEIEISGYIRNNIKCNLWKEYNNNRVFKENFYINVNDTAYVSETIYYDKFGKVDKDNSDYIKWRSPDTLFVGESILGIDFKSPFGSGSYKYVCIGYDINYNFTNTNRVKIDSFPYQDENAFIKLKFNDTGKQTIRGFIYEVVFDIDNDEALLKSYNRYFEKEFYIIPCPAAQSPRCSKSPDFER